MAKKRNKKEAGTHPIVVKLLSELSRKDFADKVFSAKPKKANPERPLLNFDDLDSAS